MLVLQGQGWFRHFQDIKLCLGGRISGRFQQILRGSYCDMVAYRDQAVDQFIQDGTKSVLIFVVQPENPADLVNVTRDAHNGTAQAPSDKRPGKRRRGRNDRIPSAL